MSNPFHETEAPGSWIDRERVVLVFRHKVEVNQPLASAVEKISEADAWNARTGGTQRVTLDCLEVRALNRHFSGAVNNQVTDAEPSTLANTRAQGPRSV